MNTGGLCCLRARPFLSVLELRALETLIRANQLVWFGFLVMCKNQILTSHVTFGIILFQVRLGTHTILNG